MITENGIKSLGFERSELDEPFNGKPEYYYSYDIVNGLSLITNTNVDANKEGWQVEIFNVEPGIEFTDFIEVQTFINNIESKIVKK